MNDLIPQDSGLVPQDSGLIPQNFDLSTLQTPEFLVTEGQFDLPGFDEMLAEIDLLGNYLRTIEVTPENIKENKKLVAQVRKISDKLNRDRIDFKNAYLRPYEQLAEKFKILTDRAQVCENLVRDQIKELEQREREEKEKEIQEVFNLRLRAYGSDVLYPYESFMKPQYLNKSMSFNKVEKEMVQWFEQRKMEIEMLEDFSKTIDAEYTDILNYYLKSGNLAETCRHYQAKVEEKKTLEENLSRQPKRRGKTTKYRMLQFKVENQEEIERLLNEHNIEYKLI